MFSWESEIDFGSRTNANMILLFWSQTNYWKATNQTTNIRSVWSHDNHCKLIRNDFCRDNMISELNRVITNAQRLMLFVLFHCTIMLSSNWKEKKNKSSESIYVFQVTLCSVFQFEVFVFFFQIASDARHINCVIWVSSQTAFNIQWPNQLFFLFLIQKSENVTNI